MCMIAYRPVTDGRGANIPNAVIDTATQRHPDGFGVAWREDGELKTAKFGPASRKAFRKTLKRVDRAGYEYVAHFRWATHGPKAQSHAHPYEYTHPEDGRVLVFHNGVIGIKTTAEQSDTEVFVASVLAQLPSRWWAQPALVYLVNEAIGWSKLVIMTATETVNLHESRGDWDSGIWYSSDHKPAKWTKYEAGKGSETGTPAASNIRIVTPGSSGVRYATYSDWDAARTKSAKDSMRAMGFDVDEDTYKAYDEYNAACDTSRALVPYAGNAVRDVDRYAGLRHGGHSVSDIVGIAPKDGYGDYPEGVVCDMCHTLGDAYVIDGVVYIDMAHKFDDDEYEEAGRAFTMASDLLPNA